MEKQLVSTVLSDQVAETLERVKRSLVQIQAGHMGAGAGILWRQDGIIVTNNHVAGRGRLTVTLADGSRFSARLLGRSPDSDLAVLKIEAAGLPTALISDSRESARRANRICGRSPLGPDRFCDLRHHQRPGDRPVGKWQSFPIHPR